MSDRWDESNVPSMDERVVLVTGANAGLGLAASTVFARRGSRVLLACRNIRKAEEAERKMRAKIGGTPDFEIVQLDLASLSSPNVEGGQFYGPRWMVRC